MIFHRTDITLVAFWFLIGTEMVQQLIDYPNKFRYLRGNILEENSVCKRDVALKHEFVPMPNQN